MANKFNKIHVFFMSIIIMSIQQHAYTMDSLEDVRESGKKRSAKDDSAKISKPRVDSEKSAFKKVERMTPDKFDLCVEGLLFLSSKNDTSENIDMEDDIEESQEPMLARRKKETLSIVCKSYEELLTATGHIENNEQNSSPLHTIASQGTPKKSTWNNASTALQVSPELYYKINNQDKDGFTALHIACDMGDAGMVKLLLNYSARPNIFNKDGYTPIHLASIKGYHNIIEIFAAKDQKLINILSQNGKTPFDCTKKKSTQEYFKTKNAEKSPNNKTKKQLTLKCTHEGCAKILYSRSGFRKHKLRHEEENNKEKNQESPKQMASAVEPISKEAVEDSSASKDIIEKPTTQIAQTVAKIQDFIDLSKDSDSDSDDNIIDMTKDSDDDIPNVKAQRKPKAFITDDIVMNSSSEDEDDYDSDDSVPSKAYDCSYPGCKKILKSKDAFRRHKKEHDDLEK